jgi:hypothetical protein
MFEIDSELTIHLTRGDAVYFDVRTETYDATGNAVSYIFAKGDSIAFKVFEKGKCDNVLLSKIFPAIEGSETVTVYLSSEETTIGDVINKPTDYWYEVELLVADPAKNPMTIIGYDKDGAKVLKLYPEGVEE